MKINIYKEETLFTSITFNIIYNPMGIYFMNKEFINEYKITPDLTAQDRHNFTYSFNGKNYLVNIHSSLAEVILNNYRIELLEE